MNNLCYLNNLPFHKHLCKITKNTKDQQKKNNYSLYISDCLFINNKYESKGFKKNFSLEIAIKVKIF